ncbi:MAG: hypothetical protein AAF485_26780 [Chloroflexota bacterium]
MQDPHNPPPEGGLKIVLYLVSFFIPIGGIIIGVIYMQRPDEANKSFGKMCLYIAVGSIALSLLCVICYVIFFVVLAASGELGLMIGLMSALA